MPLLEYASPQATPPRWRIALYHLRFVLLAGYLLLLGGAIWFWIEMDVEIGVLLIGLLVLVGFQALFLIGMPQLRWPRPTRR